MRNWAMIPALLALSLGVTACGEVRFGDDEAGAKGTDVAASGNTVTRTYALNGFSEIVGAGPDSIVIRRGDAFAVSATGDSALLDGLIIKVDGNALEVRRRNGLNWRGDHATITVTLPVLTSLVVAGSGDITADTLTGDNAEVNVAGSGDVALTGIDARKVEFNIVGSGSITAAGKADEVDSTIAGSGDISATAFSASKAEVNVIGSGGVSMTVTGTADVTTAGSGDVTITGGATCTSNKMGSGDVSCS